MLFFLKNAKCSYYVLFSMKHSFLLAPKIHAVQELVILVPDYGSN